MRRFRRSLAPLALLIALALFASPLLTPPAGAQTPKRGGTLVVGNDEDAVGLDPHLSVAFASSNYFEHVYSGLIRFNAKMELEGELASSWDIPDPRTYVFKLRKGIKFHNGREMTSEDVRYSIERIRDPKNGSVLRSVYATVERVETPDAYTVRLKLSKPDAALLGMLATRASYVVPKEEVEKHGTLQKDAVGTGPFKLAEYITGSHMRFVRNDQYFEAGLPYLDGFTIQVIKDESSRLAALRKGTVDLTWIKAPEIEELARKEKTIVSADTPEARHPARHRALRPLAPGDRGAAVLQARRGAGEEAHGRGRPAERLRVHAQDLRAQPRLRARRPGDAAPARQGRHQSQDRAGRVGGAAQPGAHRRRFPFDRLRAHLVPGSRGLYLRHASQQGLVQRGRLLEPGLGPHARGAARHDRSRQASGTVEGSPAPVGAGGADHLPLRDADALQCVAAQREGLPGHGQLVADLPARDLGRALSPARRWRPG